MKIVEFKEFVKFPPGTIFSYFEPYAFYGLWRKEETIYSDWAPELCPDGEIDYFQRPLIPTNESLEIGHKERWGELEWRQKYVIYEENDLKTLKELL